MSRRRREPHRGRATALFVLDETMPVVPATVDAEARRLITLDGLADTLFIEAGAGSGKTTTIVDRIVNLVVVAGVELQNIAAITFTEAAAAELRDRVRAAFERRADESSGEALRRCRCRTGADRHRGRLDVAQLRATGAVRASDRSRGTAALRRARRSAVDPRSRSPLAGLARRATCRRRQSSAHRMVDGVAHRYRAPAGRHRSKTLPAIFNENWDRLEAVDGR